MGNQTHTPYPEGVHVVDPETRSRKIDELNVAVQQNRQRRNELEEQLRSTGATTHTGDFDVAHAQLDPHSIAAKMAQLDLNFASLVESLSAIQQGRDTCKVCNLVLPENRIGISTCCVICQDARTNVSPRHRRLSAAFGGQSGATIASTILLMERWQTVGNLAPATNKMLCQALAEVEAELNRRNQLGALEQVSAFFRHLAGSRSKANVVQRQIAVYTIVPRLDIWRNAYTSA